MFIFSSSCHLVCSYLPLSRTNKPSLVTKRTALFGETILTTKITSWHLISVTERSEFIRRDFFPFCRNLSVRVATSAKKIQTNKQKNPQNFMLHTVSFQPMTLLSTCYYSYHGKSSSPKLVILDVRQYILILFQSVPILVLIFSLQSCKLFAERGYLCT